MASDPQTPAASIDRLGEISNVPLSERIAGQLREQILDGDLPPGFPLVEVALAAELGVSRAPMREALRILSLDGLVETIPYRGTTVRGLRRRDVEELQRIRTLHEAFAIRRIIERADPNQLSALYASCDEMEQVGSDVTELNRVDERFHSTLIDFADHALLSNFWRTIKMQVRQVMAMSNRQIADSIVIASNHRRIVDAIAAGDAALASRLVEEHVDQVVERVLENWSEREVS
jgi:DNA-binding GntR family transcriptional regulator